MADIWCWFLHRRFTKNTMKKGKVKEKVSERRFYWRSIWFLSFWFWGHFCSWLCCRAFRILPSLQSNIFAICWQRAGSCVGVAHEADRKNQKCHLSALNVSWSKGRRIETALLRMCVQWMHVSPRTIYHVSVPFSLTLHAKYRIESTILGKYSTFIDPETGASARATNGIFPIMRITEAAQEALRQRKSLAAMKTSISFTTGGVRDSNISKPWQCFPISPAFSEARRAPRLRTGWGWGRVETVSRGESE